ncbi:MAG: hypothetical protein R3F36_03910 [Candidatus Competibacteraceae bacterium]
MRVLPDDPKYLNRFIEVESAFAASSGAGGTFLDAGSASVQLSLSFGVKAAKSTRWEGRESVVRG